mgnify:CR=1 FL=1
MSGVLPIALEEATKTIQVLLESGKEYVCVMRLHSDVPEDRLKEVLMEFEGKIYQRPPARASVKRRVRVRRVYYIDLLEIEGRDVLLRIGCQAGTYVRKICHDIGEVLGCGAHMQELRRTRSGPFTEDEKSVTLHDIVYLYGRWQETGDLEYLRKFILPMEETLRLIPKIYVRDSAVDALCHGAHLTAPGVVSLEAGINKGSMVALLTLKGEAISLATATATTKEILQMNHGIVAINNRVLMPRGTYPKMWRTRQKRP